MKDGIGVSLAIIGILAILSINGCIGGCCWPYAINSWLDWAGKDASIGWWHGFGIAYVPAVGQLHIPTAVITWIVSLFVS